MNKLTGREYWQDQSYALRNSQVLPMDDGLNEKTYSLGFQDGFELAIQKCCHLTTSIGMQSENHKISLLSHLIRAIGKGSMNEEPETEIKPKDTPHNLIVTCTTPSIECPERTSGNLCKADIVCVHASIKKDYQL